VTVTLDAGVTLEDSRVDTILLASGAGGQIIANCRVASPFVIDLSDVTVTGSTFDGDVTVTTLPGGTSTGVTLTDVRIRASDLIVTGADFGSTLFDSNFSDVIITSTGRLRVAETGFVQRSNFDTFVVGDTTASSSPNVIINGVTRCSFGNITTLDSMSITGATQSTFSNVQCLTLALAGVLRNYFTGVNVLGVGLTLAGDPSGCSQQLFSACNFGSVTMGLTANSQCQWDNCQGFGTWTLNGFKDSVSNCHIGSGAGPNFFLNGNRCRVTGSSLNTAGTLDGDDLVFANNSILNPIGLSSLVIGGGASTANLAFSGNRCLASTIVTQGVGAADQGAYTGNTFAIVPVIGGAAPTAAALFVGNTGTGAIGGPAGANAASGNNT
jgi:hypothetical protein